MLDFLFSTELINISWWVLLALILLAFLAGLLDALVGGGGLIMVPGLLTLLPDLPIPMLWGSNKVISIAGTSMASYHYARAVPLQWRWLLPGFFMTIAFAMLGGKCATIISSEIFRPIILFFLMAVAWINFRSNLLSKNTDPAIDTPATIHPLKIMIMCSIIGFYDGFIGPGTGIFLIFGFVYWGGLNFLHASAHAKIINMASNLGALIYFIPTGHIFWSMAIVLALCNIFGSYLGSRMAIAHGVPLIRWVFRLTVLVLIGKFMLDTVKLTLTS